MFALAEMLGRTVKELLYGSLIYEPLSSAELTEWFAHKRLEAEELKQQAANKR